jgi:hypothetical protein
MEPTKTLRNERGSKRWIIRPRPFPDELLSSWMTRLAHAHGVSLRCFVNETWPGQRVLAASLDMSPPDGILWELAHRADLPIENIHRLLVSELVNPRYRGHSEEFRQLNRLPRLLRSVLPTGTQVCPECLASDPSPYLRRSWRLSTVTACPRHKRLLTVLCRTCRPDFIRPISAKSVDHDITATYGEQWHCLCSLVLPEQASLLAIRFQNHLLTILERAESFLVHGEFDLDLHQNDFQFVVGHLLSKGSAGAQFQARLQKCMKSDPHGGWSSWRYIVNSPFRLLGVRKRHAFMAAAGWALFRSGGLHQKPRPPGASMGGMLQKSVMQ